MNNSRIKTVLGSCSVSLVALLLSMITGAIIISTLGKNPIEVYSALFNGAFGSKIAIVGTINRMIPIMFAGLAIAVGNKCSVFNIGVEGQFLIGSLFAVYAGVYLDIPPFLHVLVTILVSIVGGVLWAILPAVLRIKKNVSIVFSTIMLNYIALYLCNYLIPFMKGYDPVYVASPKISETAYLPFLSADTRISTGIFIALFTVVAVYVFLFKTKWGYELRAVGYNSNACKSAGINVNRNTIMALLISGGLAGLIGGVEITGTAYRLQEGANSGYLPAGIAVAMLAQGNPFAIILSAFLFASMSNGAALMQMSTGVSAQFVSIIQGLIIIFICSEKFLKWIYQKVKTRSVKHD